MPINPNIALSARPVEIADPLAMYGKIAAIQGAQQQNALAQYQLGAAQRSEAATNALSQAYQAAYDPQTGGIDRNKLRQSLATGGFGAQIPTVEKALGELETQALTRQKTENELFDQSMSQIRNLWGNVRTVEDAIAVHDMTHRDPIINKRLKALGVTEEMGRNQILQAAQNPQTFAEFVQKAQLGAAKFAELNKPTTQVVDQSGQKQVIQIPGLGGKPTTVGTFADVPLPPAVAQQKKEIARAGATTIDMRQESEFEKALGAGQAKRVLDSKATAEDAAQILRTNQVGRDILKSGAITGTGADFFVGFNNALKQAGIDFGYADAAANSQAYAAAMGANVGKIIKQFGAGTGLSDDDRKFAEQMAGGRISLTDTALRRILDINDRAANNVIDKHNKDVRGIKTNVPLTVEKPVFEQAKPSAANQIPGQTPTPAVAIPQAAIDALKAGKGTDAQFDEIFGPGAAKRARGGK